MTHKAIRRKALNHFKIYNYNRNQIIAIIWFLSILVFLSILIGFLSSDRYLFIDGVISIFIIGILGHYLLEGKMWAKVLTILMAIISIFQVYLSLIEMTNIWAIIINILLIASFIYIIWYLGSSGKYNKYIKLRGAGFSPPKDLSPELDELVDTNEIISIKYREIYNINSYSELTKLLIGRSDHIKDIIEYRIDDDNKKITLETSETIFEIEVNSNIGLMEKGFVNKINSILSELGDQKRYFFIYPDSILNPTDGTYYLLYETVSKHRQLIKYGYSNGNEENFPNIEYIH